MNKTEYEAYELLKPLETEWGAAEFIVTRYDKAYLGYLEDGIILFLKDGEEYISAPQNWDELVVREPYTDYWL